MEKRALIAVALAFVILFLYQQFFFEAQPQKVKKHAEVEKKEEPTSAKAVEVIVPKKAAKEEKEIRVNTELYSAIFTTRGGTLKYYDIKKYKDKDGKNVVLLKSQGIKPPLAIGSQEDLNLSDANFYTPGKDILLNKDKTSNSLVFEYSNKNSSRGGTKTSNNN